MRITRTRQAPAEEAPALRVRRVLARTPAPEEAIAPTRVRRIRTPPLSPLPAPSITLNSPVRSRAAKRKEWKESFEQKDRSVYIVDWERSLGGLFQLYLMASYLYYERDFSVLTDHDYDRICKTLEENFESFEHPHKYLVTLADLSATTGFAIRYPTIVKLAADYMQQSHIERKSA